MSQEDERSAVARMKLQLKIMGRTASDMGNWHAYYLTIRLLIIFMKKKHFQHKTWLHLATPF